MKLTTKKRNSLPDSAFAGPGRSFPVNDKSHARNALARASQAVNEGRMSPSTEAHIRSKAENVLHSGHFKAGEAHADSPRKKQDGDGVGHWSGR